MRTDNQGFTLIEMLIVMTIFTAVIMISSSTFQIMLGQASKLYKSEESSTAGVVGLEILRHDIEQAGFGLPYSYQTPPITYVEAGSTPAKNYNDAPSGVPRALIGDIVAGSVADNQGSDGGTYSMLAGTGYLTLKASSLGPNDASQKWSYVTYSSSGKAAKTWPSANFQNGDSMIMIRRSFQSSGITNQLAYNTATPTNYWATYSNTATGYGASFSPVTPTDIMYAYGVTSGGSVGMPFNRVDYLVATPSNATSAMPVCAPSTGILYRAFLNHSNSGGNLTYLPLLDCVADMQVVFGWNLFDPSGNFISSNTTTGGGSVDTWSNETGTQVSGATMAQVQSAMADPGQIRTKLKLVKVYVLAQNGPVDLHYTSPSSILYDDKNDPNNSNSLILPALGFPLTPAMQHYRWKVYKIVVKPKNMLANQ